MYLAADVNVAPKDKTGSGKLSNAGICDGFIQRRKMIGRDNMQEFHKLRIVRRSDKIISEWSRENVLRLKI